MKEEKRQSTKAKKRSVIGSIVRILLYVLLFLIVFVIISIVGINIYLQSNEKKIFDQLPFLNNGSISFEQTSISIFKDFPSATLSLKQVTLADSLFDVHQLPFLQSGEVHAVLSLDKLLKYKSIEIHTIRLKDGAINLHTDDDGYSNLKSLFSSQSKQIEAEEKKGRFKDFKVNLDALDLELTNMRIRFTNDPKKNSVIGTVNQLSALLELDLETKQLTTLVDLDVLMEELAINKEQGAFLTNGRVLGKVPLTFKDGVLSFAPFDLQINEEQFLFSGRYDTKKATLSNLILENQATRYEKMLPLLPRNIRKAMKPYQVFKPFYTKTTIESFFKSGETPMVNIDFRMKDNDLSILNHTLNRATFEGRFVNRIYDDRRARFEGGNRFRLETKELTGRQRHFKISAPSVLVTVTPQEGPRVNVKVNVEGPAAKMSQWLENDQFFFTEGHFNFNANIQGPINDFNQLVIETNASLMLEDIAVTYLPANVALPFKHLELLKKSGDADFTLISSALRKGHNFRLDGGLKNLPALLIDLAEQRASSEVQFVADQMSWYDFIDLFGKNGYLKNGQTPAHSTKTDSEKKKSMKATISGIHHNFQPRISVSVDTLEYYDLIQLQAFQTGVHFENAHTLILEKTSFLYDRGSVDFSGRLDISDPHQTPFEFELHTKNLNLQKLLPPLNFFNIQLLANMDSQPEDISIDVRHKGILDDQKGLIPNTSFGEIVFKSVKNKAVRGKITYEPDTTLGKIQTRTRIDLEGDPAVFNTFFNTEQFFFSEGKFAAQVDYTGDVASVEQLFNEAIATLSLENSKVYYKPVDVHFPLTQVELKLDNDQADFNLFLKSDSLKEEIQFVGLLENLSELVIGSTGKTLKTKVDVYSPQITWKHFLDIFAPPSEAPKKETNITSLKNTLKGMLTTFDPSIHVKIDQFIYSKGLMVDDLFSGIYLIDSTQLVLDQTGFTFHDGLVGASGQFDLSYKDRAPFEANFHTQDLDFSALLESLEYLSLPVLQEIKKLQGRVTMNLDLAGTLTQDGMALVPEDTKGLLNFDLRDVEIKGMPALEVVAEKIRMRGRFSDLRFAPISNQIRIEGQSLDIPMMEIQSNALHFFIEGIVSYDDQTNIWLSIPISNLKSIDRDVIPPKKGYANTKKKVYLEVFTDEAGKNQTKFHLTKKKFYKDRDLLHQYKKDVRENRKIRRAIRRHKRLRKKEMGGR